MSVRQTEMTKMLFIPMVSQTTTTCFIIPTKRPLFQDNLGYLYQKGKTSLDLNEARDDEVWEAVAPAGPYANNLHLAPDR